MSILLFFLVLFLLILVHELGHFLAAKKFGIRVDEFGMGFPPKVVGKKIGETEYTLNALPLGGFVRIFGEDAEEETLSEEEKKRNFSFRPWWQKAIVLVAGVGFNILLAWVLFVGGFVWGMPTALSPEERADAQEVRLLVVRVLPNSPAARAGLRPGDEIVAAALPDGTVADELTPEKIVDFVAAAGAREVPVLFTVRRDGAVEVIPVTPQRGLIAEEAERAAVGVQMSLAGVKRLPLLPALWEGTRMTGTMLAAVAVGIAGFLYDALTLDANFSQVTGPVGIAGMVGDASALGFAYLVTFTAFISLNLAVINLLPFPALDGGRLVIVLLEALLRRPVNATAVQMLNRFGFVFLLVLMAVVTYNDVLKLFR